MTTHHCPSHPCPLCYPTYQYPPSYPHYGYGTVAAPHGCICPPGSELTCKGLGCPRKSIGSASGIAAATAVETTEIGSTGGKSPTGKAGDAQ